MRLLSIGRSHDANFCLYDSETNFFSFVKIERETNQKHAKFGERGLQFLLSVLKQYNFVPDSVAIDGGDPEHKKIYDKGFGENFEHDMIFKSVFSADHFNGAERFWVDHHYAHVLSSWPLGYFEYGIAVDGRGPTQNTTMIFKDPFDLNNCKTIYENEYKSTEKASFGRVFDDIGYIMGLSGSQLDFGGKFMGAQAYGMPDEEYLESLDVRSIREVVRANLVNPVLNFSGEKSFENSNYLNLLTTYHKAWELILESLILEFIPKSSTVCFSGGVAQNTIFNERIFRHYPRMEFVPHCYDGGTSIGSMAFLCLYYGISFPSRKGFPYWQKDEIKGIPTHEILVEIAIALQNGKIVGWHHGRGEIGPRALGNRSILMSPTISDGKKILNDLVKHREHWRPYSASVLEEYAGEWFVSDTPSPYMMRAIQVRNEKWEQIPAVVHVDGTCRIQTVNREQNPLFYNLISEFHSLSGIPILLNTSLNNGGSPIVGRKESTLDLLKNSGLDMVCIGGEIIKKWIGPKVCLLRN